EHTTRLLAEHHPRGHDQVTPDVHESAATPLRDAADVGGVVAVITEHAGVPAHVANCAGSTEFHHTPPLRVRPHHERFLDDDTRPVANGRQFARFSGVQANGFFAQDV